MWDGRAFSGAKVAIFVDDGLITYKRDEKPGIPYSGSWDLPGGGREGDESPIECVKREVREEFGLTLDDSRFIYQRHYEPDIESVPGNEFFVAHITKLELDEVVFGPEGQYWKVMKSQEFIEHLSSVPKLKAYVEVYILSKSVEY